MRKIRLLASMLLLVAIPGPATANMGLPMIVIALPWLVLCILPVIAIEAWILKHRFRLSTRQSAITSTLANLASTLLGVPATWVVLAFLQMTTGGGGIPYDFDTWLGKLLSVTWQAPWLIPFDDDFYWMVPTAMAVLFVPFFFVSWWVEAKVGWARHRVDAIALAAESAQSMGSDLQGRAHQAMSRTWRDANLVTYAIMLLAFVLLVLITGIARGL